MANLDELTHHGHEGVASVLVKHGAKSPSDHMTKTGSRKAPEGVAAANNHPNVGHATTEQKHAFHSDMLKHHAEHATKTSGAHLKHHIEQMVHHGDALKLHAGDVHGKKSASMSQGSIQPANVMDELALRAVGKWDTSKDVRPSPRNGK